MEPRAAMKMRLVSIGLVISAVLMLGMWMAAQQRQESVERMIAQPEPAAAPTTGATGVAGVTDPNPSPAATPEARADQGRLAFERQARAFLRDAPRLDDATRMARARALSQDIDRREQNRELSGDEATMMRVGLIQVAVKDPRERVIQIQEVIDRQREKTAARQRALLARQQRDAQALLAQKQRDAQLREYKVQEARIVSEVLAMDSYPDGLSRDAYLRQRLQAARDTINRTPAPAPTSTP